MSCMEKYKMTGMNKVTKNHNDEKLVSIWMKKNIFENKTPKNTHSQIINNASNTYIQAFDPLYERMLFLLYNKREQHTKYRFFDCGINEN